MAFFNMHGFRVYKRDFFTCDGSFELCIEGVILVGNRLMTGVTKSIRYVLFQEFQCFYSMQSSVKELFNASLWLRATPCSTIMATSFVFLCLPLTKQLPFCSSFPLFANLPVQLLQSTR